jgi:hypothetical protein
MAAAYRKDPRSAADNLAARFEVCKDLMERQDKQ